MRPGGQNETAKIRPPRGEPVDPMRPALHSASCITTAAWATPGNAGLIWAVFALSALSACSNNLDELFCDPDCLEPAITTEPDAETTLAEEGADSGATPMSDDAEPAVTPKADGDGASETEPEVIESPPPILPRLPDESAEQACAACTEETCAAERSACLEDDACTAQLRCYGECRDPSCAEDCRGATALDGDSPFYQDLAKCSGTRCGTACQAGANWGCAGHFAWPALNSEPFLDAYVRFGAGQLASGDTKLSLGGASVRPCCTNSTLDAVPLDAANGAQLKLPTDGNGFIGYFELEAPEVRGGLKHLVQIPPVAHGGDLSVYLYEQYIITETLGWVPAESTAAVFAIALDCMAVPAAQTRLRIAEQSLASVAHHGLSGLDYNLAQSSAGMAFFPELSVPDFEQLTLEVLISDGADEGQVVARRPIPVRAGWLSQVTIMPSSLRGF